MANFIGVAVGRCKVFFVAVVAKKLSSLLARFAFIHGKIVAATAAGAVACSMREYLFILIFILYYIFIYLFFGFSFRISAAR